MLKIQITEKFESIKHSNGSSAETTMRNWLKENYSLIVEKIENRCFKEFDELETEINNFFDNYINNFQIGDCSLTSIAISLKGDKLIVGDENGKISLLKLSKSFYSQDDIELKKDNLGKMFERELLRERYLENLARKRINTVVVESKNEEKLALKIKEKIRKIETAYIPFVNSLLNKSDMLLEK